MNTPARRGASVLLECQENVAGYGGLVKGSGSLAGTQPPALGKATGVIVAKSRFPANPGHLTLSLIGRNAKEMKL